MPSKPKRSAKSTVRDHTDVPEDGGESLYVVSRLEGGKEAETELLESLATVFESVEGANPAKALAVRRIGLTDLPDPAMLALLTEDGGARQAWAVLGPGDLVASIPVADSQRERPQEALKAWLDTLAPAGLAALLMASLGMVPGQGETANHYSVSLSLDGLTLPVGVVPEKLAERVEVAVGGFLEGAEEVSFWTEEDDGIDFLDGHVIMDEDFESDDEEGPETRITQAVLNSLFGVTPRSRIAAQLEVFEELD
ncbi:MAG: hypothetical protein LBJ08_10055 [Bifidobacteriaceae bacterium]|jgi:hypothetical protein|nr:hypothetical protein [Bifidobacteriaceae bacterium]